MKKGLSPTAWSTLPFLAAGDFSVSHPCLGVNASLLPTIRSQALSPWRLSANLFSLEMGGWLPSEKCWPAVGHMTRGERTSCTSY